MSGSSGRAGSPWTRATHFGCRRRDPIPCKRALSWSGGLFAVAGSRNGSNRVRVRVRQGGREELLDAAGGPSQRRPVAADEVLQALVVEVAEVGRIELGGADPAQVRLQVQADLRLVRLLGPRPALGRAERVEVLVEQPPDRLAVARVDAPLDLPAQLVAVAEALGPRLAADVAAPLALVVVVDVRPPGAVGELIQAALAMRALLRHRFTFWGSLRVKLTPGASASQHCHNVCAPGRDWTLPDAPGRH